MHNQDFVKRAWIKSQNFFIWLMFYSDNMLSKLVQLKRITDLGAEHPVDG